MAAASVKAPGWLGKQGPGRIMAEFRALHRDIAASRLQGVSEVSLVDDDVSVWRLSVTAFDADTPAGRQLNADLEALGRRHGAAAAAVVLELRFADDYPASPFFLRVVRPRMAMYSGHVTAGGSVCIEALTHSGGPGAWRPDLCVESVLSMVLFNMLNAEAVYVQTPAGGSGRAGPLRIDMHQGLREYSLAEAQHAFQRTLHSHGWSVGARKPPPVPAPAAAPRLVAAAPRLAPAAALAALAGVQAAPPPAALPRPPARPQPAAGARASAAGAAAAAPAAPAAGPSRKRTAELVEAEVIDLLGDSDDEMEVVVVQSSSGGNSGGLARSSGSGASARPLKRPAGLLALPPGGGNRSSVVDLAAGNGEQPKRQRLREAAVAAAVAAQASLAEQLQEANAETGLRLVEPPPHWEVTARLLRGDTQLTLLPLPGQGAPAEQADEEVIAVLIHNGFSRHQALQALKECGGDASKVLDPQWLLEWQLRRQSEADPASLAELRDNGLSDDDAHAALAHCHGDVMRALAFAFECQENGGPAAVARRLKRGGAAARADPAEEAARRVREAKQRALEAEVEGVLKRFESESGVARSRVRSIERVQSLLLWTKYTNLRAEITLQVNKQGAALNERRLFHGADKASAGDTLAIIINEGFDHRVSNLHGALGAGNYFAASSSYSNTYSQMAKHSADSLATQGNGGFRAAHGSTPLPPPSAAVGHTARPRFHSNCVAMLLCDVTLGREGPLQPQQRRPLPGYHSTSSAGTFAVYENAQAYPHYLIHYQ